jgi:hypothetical protein
LSEDEEIEDVDDNAHWTWRSKCQKEFPTYAAFEAIDEDEQPVSYQAYPVERGDRVTRQTRTSAMNKPIQNPKTKFDGVHIPSRRPHYGEPENVPGRPQAPVSVPAKQSYQPPPKPPTPFRPKENILPARTGPVPFEACKPRNIETLDIEMKEPEPILKESKEGKKPIHLQDYVPPKHTDTKSNEPQPQQECARTYFSPSI